MKKLFLPAAMLFAAFQLAGQAAEAVVVVSAKGKVSLLSQGNPKASPLSAGAVVRKSSTLVLGKRASAVLYCGGQFKTAKGVPKIGLDSFCAQGTATRRVDADYDFGEKLLAAVEMVAAAKHRGDGWGTALTDPKKGGDGWGTALTDPKKGGDGWGTALTDPKKGGDGWGTALTDPKKGGDGWGTALTDPKKGSDGWGGKGGAIRIIMPFGKLRPGPTLFRWSKPATTEPYVLSIVDESGKLAYKQTLKDTFALLDLNALGLAEETVYRWKVQSGEQMVSGEALFGIAPADDWKETREQLRQSALHSSANDPVLAQLVEAVALENAEWYYEAQLLYAKSQKESKDPLVRMMHAAFWARYGFWPLSEKAAKG